MAEPGLRSKYWDKRCSNVTGASAPLWKVRVWKGGRGVRMSPRLSWKSRQVPEDLELGDSFPGGGAETRRAYPPQDKKFKNLLDPESKHKGPERALIHITPFTLEASLFH